MSGSAQVELVCDPGCLLAEGPLWNQAEKKLYFTDIENRCLWRCDPETGVAEIAWKHARKIGGFAWTREGDLILCAEDRVDKLCRGGRWETLFAFNFPKGERFNDITTDPEGRIFAGTMQAGLYRLEKGKDPVRVLDKIHCSNGMAFSPDEKTFYHTSTQDFVINRYDYDRATGAITHPRCLLKCDPAQGWPDGMTMDADGYLWSAFWRGGAIRRLSPEGAVVRTVKLPAKIPTSVIFGGDQLRDLFITTSSWGRVSEENRVDAAGEFLGGGVYRFTPEIGGRPEWPAAL